MSKSSSLFYRIYFILVIFLCLENAEGSDTSAFLLKKLHLLYRRRRVGQERSRSSQFTFATLNTHVAKSYSELPPLPSQLSTILSELSGAKPCGASLSVTLTKFRKKGSRTMCLFKIQPDSIQLQSIFHQGSGITIGDQRLSPSQLYAKIQPVRGFLVGYPSSVVHGHISQRNEFYGWIKLVDKRRGHHIAFYVEPIENAPLYNTRFLDSPIARMESDNAILFEMIPKPHNHHPKSTNKSHSITSLNLKTRSITTSTIMEHSSSVSATPEAEQAVEFSTEDDDASTDSTGSDSMGIGSMESTFMTDPNDIQQSTTVDKIPTSSVTQSVTSITSPLDSSLSQTTSTALLTISSTSDDSEVSDPPEVYDDENSTLVSPESSGHMPESFVTKTPQANLSVGDIGNITSTTSSHDDDYEDFKKPSMGNFSSDGELKTQTNDTNKFGDLPFHSTAIVTGSQPVNSVLTFGTINVSQRTSTSPPDPEDKSSSTSSGAEGSFSTTLRRKRDPIFHSTQATPRPRPKNNSRVRRNLDLFNFLLPSGDIADELDLTGEDWSKSETLFSQSLSAHPICSLCIWIQPNFASSFGAKSGLLHGISEVVQIVRLTDWLLRSQDFNEDGLPDNIGLKIKTIFTSDTIHLKPTQAEKDDAKSGPLYPLMRSTHRKNKRSLKDSAAFDPSNYDHNLAFESVDTDYPTHILDNPNDAMKLGIPIPRKPTSMEDAPLEEIPFSKMIYSVTAKETFARIAPQMRAQEELTGCCARLAFIYHNISPSLSISTKNGGCDRINNLILISGLYGTSKVGTWDIVRHLLHSIGHILGADHENLVDGKCGLHHVDTQETERAFLDPPVMDPRPYLNMGLRPASHRFSACARHGMALFLTSQNAHCLKGAHDEAVCGNGLVEGDEVCDCGSPSTCLLSGGCCGESVFSCAKVDCSAGQ